MTQYIIPKARCIETAQTVVEHDLAGIKFQPHQQIECKMLADRLAEKLTFKTGRRWQGYCAVYSTK